MKLTTTEKYALAALESNEKMSSLQKQERGICLVASCIWDMIEAEVIVPDTKGKLKVSTPLPEKITYCSSIYELLAKKPRKPEDVVLEYTHTLTDKRMKALVESIVNGLAGKSALTVEEQDGLLSTKLCHVEQEVLADDMAAIKNLDGAVTPDQFMLAILLLKSGVAKKLLDREELSKLKKVAKQDRGDFQPYVKNMITMTDSMISSIIAAFMITQ